MVAIIDEIKNHSHGQVERYYLFLETSYILSVFTLIPEQSLSGFSFYKKGGHSAAKLRHK